MSVPRRTLRMGGQRSVRTQRTSERDCVQRQGSILEKKKKWIHSHICTEPGQAHPLPSSLSPPSVTSLLELLLLPPPLSLLCPWSPLIYVLSRLQRKFRVTIAKQMPATSCVAFKHLRVWGESKESEKVTPIRALTCMALHGMRECYMDKMSIGRTRPC